MCPAMNHSGTRGSNLWVICTHKPGPIRGLAGNHLPSGRSMIDLRAMWITASLAMLSTTSLS
jgi:hypothetical protein